MDMRKIILEWGNLDVYGKRLLGELQHGVVAVPLADEVKSVDLALSLFFAVGHGYSALVTRTLAMSCSISLSTDLV